MNFTSIFIKMIQLFVVILLGYIANKANILDKDARAKLSKLVINVTLPAMILASVLAQNNLPEPMQILSLILVAALSYVILFGAAFVLPRLLHVPKSQIGIYEFILAFGNVGFIGFPVTEAIFGSQSVFYTSVFNMPFNIFVYSVGVAFLTKNQESSSSGAEEKVKISWRTFVSPCLISSAIAIILAFANIKAPKAIGDTCNMVGNITTPAALMIIGSSLADMPFKKMFNNVRIYIFSFFRMIVVPLITYWVFGLFIKDQLLLGTCVIISAMPVASNGTMLCLQYHADEELMAQGTFITTLFSLITIPLLALLFI